jgi:hypothetical protein
VRQQRRPSSFVNAFITAHASSSPARAVLEKRKNDLISQKTREMGSIIQAATAATMTPSLPMKAAECITRPPAAVTRQLPRGGGACARKPPPVAPLDAAKTKLPFDPLPPPPPPPKAKEPPPPPARIRMAKEREGKMPLAERLEPGDVDFGKVRFVDCDGDCGGECVCVCVWCGVWRYCNISGGGDSGACPSTYGKR